MPILAFLAPFLNWIFRGIVIKFVLMTGLFALMTFLVPLVIGYVAPFVGAANLTSAFTGLDPGVWFFLDFFALGYGVPLMISAFITRFLIRRLPVIG
jgi:hypothetical protein